ncbi:MAG: DNA alkylation repair protein [Clostridia bacterium]|nr:DNA alkylation repair protein [Clostridia bacterium]
MKNKIREKIFSLADEKYKEFHTSLCPNTDNIIGVRVPILRKYAKELIKEGFEENFLKIENQYYEEIMLKGMMIGLKKMEITTKLNYIENFIPLIDNWAICDTFVAGLKIKEKEEFYNFIQKYLDNSKSEFEIRFGLVSLLDYFIEKEYIIKIFQITEKIKKEEYYVEMAMAWLISICYIKFPKETLKYLKSNILSNFVYNKSIQKIIESTRIDNKEKEKLRKMKRK